MNQIEDDLKAALRRKPAPPGFAAKVFKQIESEALNKRAPHYFFQSWLGMAFRNEILALASAIMLVLGVVMQLGGGQSVLADSIERLTIMTAVSRSLHRATSMDCIVLKPGAGEEHYQFRVRWNAAGFTRVDMDPTHIPERTLWISKGTVSVADDEDGAVRSTTISTMLSKWKLPMEFLAPTILAQHMERFGLRQAADQGSAQPGELVLVGQENQQVVEIAINARTALPIALKKFLPAPVGTGKELAGFEEVRFQWNKAIPQELFIPGRSAIKKQVH